MLADKKIIAAIRNNEDDKVLHELYRKIKPKITAHILKNSGSREEADDIFQDGVILLFRQVKLNKYNEQHEIGAFIFSVCKNLWINKAKRDKRSTGLDEAEYQFTDHQNVLQEMITKERAHTLTHLIKILGENCEQILSLTYYKKLSLKEVAQKLGYANEGAVKTRNYKCKQRLMKLMKEKNITQSILNA